MSRRRNIQHAGPRRRPMSPWPPLTLVAILLVTAGLLTIYGSPAL